MKLTVMRDIFTDKSTTGELLIDGEFFCYTLEPRSDRSQGKPYCIPPGTYPVTLELSQHFDMVTPHVANVPGFTEIEIHPGNFSTDTKACTVVGSARIADMVENSRATFFRLMDQLQGQDEISITYVGGQNAAPVQASS